MMVQVDFWQLLTFAVGLLLSFVSAAVVMGRKLMGEVEKTKDARY